MLQNNGDLWQCLQNIVVHKTPKAVKCTVVQSNGTPCNREAVSGKKQVSSVTASSCWIHCRRHTHGGSGTTGASLRAGVPTVVTPILGDQFSFGRAQRHTLLRS